MTSQAPDPSESTAEDATQRQQEWVATMHGSAASEDLVLAHRNAPPPPIAAHAVLRAERESRSASLLANGATLAVGAGNRAIPEEPDARGSSPTANHSGSMRTVITRRPLCCTPPECDDRTAEAGAAPSNRRTARQLWTF